MNVPLFMMRLVFGPGEVVLKSSNLSQGPWTYTLYSLNASRQVFNQWMPGFVSKLLLCHSYGTGFLCRVDVRHVFMQVKWLWTMMWNVSVEFYSTLLATCVLIQPDLQLNANCDSKFIWKFRDISISLSKRGTGTLVEPYAGFQSLLNGGYRSLWTVMCHSNPLRWETYIPLTCQHGTPGASSMQVLDGDWHYLVTRVLRGDLKVPHSTAIFNSSKISKM